MPLQSGNSKILCQKADDRRQPKWGIMIVITGGEVRRKITRHGKLKTSAEDQDVGEPGQISDRCEG